MIIFPLKRPAGIAILQSLQIQVLIEKKTLHFYYLQEIIKGQEISEWIYEVVALPKIWTKKAEFF